MAAKIAITRYFGTLIIKEHRLQITRLAFGPDGFFYASLR
jgi:hypothetical protein